MVSRIPDADSHSAPPAAPPLSRRKRAALKAIAVLPTMFTLGNLIFGFLAIFIASRNPIYAISLDSAMPAVKLPELPFGWSPLTFAVLCVFGGMIMDALDGRIARLTKQTSDLGEQLDSFADMVSFGVAPAFMAIMLVNVQFPFLAAGKGDNLLDRAVLISGAIYVACAALRLARFNVEIASPSVGDHMSFKGLPSPGAAGTVCSVILLHEHFLAPLVRSHKDAPLPAAGTEESWPLWITKAGMIVVMFLVALAMVSRLRYVHAMNRYFQGKAPFNTIVIAVIGLLLVAMIPQYAIAGGLLIYAMSAPAAWLWYKTLGRRKDSDDMWVPDDDEDNASEETPPV